MASPIVAGNPYSQKITLTMFIGFKNSGWSEKYVMARPSGGTNDPPTPASVAVAAAEGCTKRAYLLGLGCSILWARLVNSAAPRQSVAVLAGALAATALAAESPVEKINDIEAALHFRFETGAGIVSNRLFRGLRDSWVTDQDITSSIVPSSWVNLTTADYEAAEGGGSYTKANAMKNFLIWIGKNTVNAKKIGPASYTYTPYDTALFRTVADHQTGIPFGGHRGRARSKV